MYHVGILYAPYDEFNKSIIDIIKNSINLHEFDIRVKKAADAAMPDIAASDIIILASSGDDTVPVHKDYMEIVRALSGVNLSGRLVGVVTFGMDKTQKFLKDVLKDTGAVYYKDGLNIKGINIEKDKIKRWTKSLLKKYEDIINDRG